MSHLADSKTVPIERLQARPHLRRWRNEPEQPAMQQLLKSLDPDQLETEFGAKLLDRPETDSTLAPSLPSVYAR